METLAAIAEVGVWAFGFVLFVAQTIAYVAGHEAGRRVRLSRHGDFESVGAVVAGMLSLLAFVLALTLTFANARFTERRVGTLAEANAIGTAWMRAAAVGGPRGEEIARLFDRYVQVRADFVRAGRDERAIEAINHETSALQTAIGGHVAAIVREKPDPVSAALMTSVNEAFDASAAERFSFEMRLPPQIFWLLLALTFTSMASLGYQLGLRGRTPRGLVMLLTVMWTAVIVAILDLATARVGAIRIDAHAYEWTRQGFAAGLPIPPPPSAR
jgi:hypothetical protein